MFQAERHDRIIELVTSNSKVTIDELCRLFEISPMTARRDLAQLDRQGLIRRVHGGAIGNRGRSYEPPYPVRSTRNVEAKQSIGRAAAALVRDGDSLALDVGTTAMCVAQALPPGLNLTILTSSLPIANEIAANLSLSAGVRLILTGGLLRADERSMVGPVAEQAYREFHVDKAFVGIGGLSLEDGLTEYNLEDALVKRALLGSAQQRIVIADGSKFGRTTFASVGPLSLVDTVVTDGSAPPAMVEALRERRIQVLVAQPQAEPARVAGG